VEREFPKAGICVCVDENDFAEYAPKLLEEGEFLSLPERHLNPLSGGADSTPGRDVSPPRSGVHRFQTVVNV